MRKKKRQPLRLLINIASHVRSLDLEPYSIRSEGFRLLVQGVNGQLNEIAPPVPSTYRGTVNGDPNSLVIASISENKLSARVELAGGNTWYIQPLSKLLPETASPRAHVVYRKEDVTAATGVCGTNDDDRLIPMPQSQTSISSASAVSGSPKVAEIAIDTDYEYYQANGYSVENTLVDIEAVMNDVTDIFLRDTSIYYTLSTVIIRSSVDDPYGYEYADLGEFASYWIDSYSHIHRDAAHLFTGKYLQGAIGVAYVSAMCDYWAYGVSQSQYTGHWPSRVALTAHELGHNWGGYHCEGEGDCGIMCPYIGGCTGVVESFGSSNVGVITGYRDGTWCLSTLSTPLRWGFNENTDLYAYESSPLEYTGTLVNMDESAWVGGMRSGALQFDGINDYVEISGYKGVVGSQARTVAAWIKTTTTGEIVTWGTAAPGEKWIFRVQDDDGAAGAIRVQVGAGAITGSTDVRDELWHHVAAVLEDGLSDIGDVKLYVDGLLESTSYSSGPRQINTASSSNMKIGVFAGSDRYFTGKIDDVRIYDYSLSKSEIAVLARWPGDFNNNRFVSLEDMAFFSRYWLITDCNKPACHLCDMDENANVDITDLTEWFKYWLLP